MTWGYYKMTWGVLQENLGGGLQDNLGYITKFTTWGVLQDNLGDITGSLWEYYKIIWEGGIKITWGGDITR